MDRVASHQVQIVHIARMTTCDRTDLTKQNENARCFLTTRDRGSLLGELADGDVERREVSCDCMRSYVMPTLFYRPYLLPR